MEMSDINRMRKWAGLPLLTEEDADHEREENKLFNEAYDKLEAVIDMSKKRLKGNIADKHRTHYEELVDCATKCCMTLKEHLKSYD